MAQDMQWPSEDEDFDAVASPESSRRRRSRAVAAEPEEQPVQQEEVVQASTPEERRVETVEPQQPVDPVEAAFADEEETEDDAYYEEEQKPEPTPAPAPETPKKAVFTVPVAEAQPEEQADPDPAPAQKAPKLPKQPRGGRNLTNVLRTALELLLVLAVLGLGYYAVMLRQDKKDLNAQVATLNSNPQIAVQKQTDQLIANVGSLMSLPQGEVPTVANVSDAAKAKQQSSFFNNAQDGDKVLMYVKAGQAILYRPSTNKIILVAPLTFNSATTTTPAATSKTTR